MAAKSPSVPLKCARQAMVNHIANAASDENIGDQNLSATGFLDHCHFGSPVFHIDCHTVHIVNNIGAGRGPGGHGIGGSRLNGHRNDNDPSGRDGPGHGHDHDGGDGSNRGDPASDQGRDLFPQADEELGPLPESVHYSKSIKSKGEFRGVKRSRQMLDLEGRPRKHLYRDEN